MQTTSATYDRILAGSDYSYETRLVIDGVGTFAENDLFSINTSIEMFQQDPEIGKAISAEINVSMINPSATIPTMAKLRPQVRACGTAPKSSKVTITGEDLSSEYATYSSENITFSSSSGATVAGENLSFVADTTEYLESEWLSQGVFFVDTRDVTANNNGLDVLTLHGFDAMLKTEQIYSSNATVGDNLDVAYVRAIASAIGVSVDPRTWEIMQTGYIIPFPLGYSMREILGYIASAYAGCFIISDTGQLRLVALEDIESETRYLIDEIGNIIVFGTNSSEHTVTASGAVATFTAGGEYDLDELEIAIEPVQDLHGYSYPWPAGGGINKWNPDTASKEWVTPQNVIGEVSIARSMRYPCTSGTVVTLSNDNNSSASNVLMLTFLGENDAVLSRNVVASGAKYISRTAVSNTVQVLAAFYTYAEASNPQLEFGVSTPSAWTPYANECPISGWTGMDINNAPTVLSLEQGGIYDANGGEAGNANRIRTDFIPISALSKGTNIIDLIQSDNVDVRKRYFYWYDANKTYIHDRNGTFNQVFPVELKRSYAPEGAEYLRIVLQNANGDIAITPNGYYLSINASTIPISWQDEAGTVYKGTLNVKTGVLTATHVIDDLGNFTYSKYNNAFYATVADMKINATVMSTVYKTADNKPGTGTAGSWEDCTIRADTGANLILIKDLNQVSLTGTQYKAYITGQKVLYELATPLTFQLSPTQVKTLLGQNNLWANTGNIINLEFTEPATEAVRILV